MAGILSKRSAITDWLIEGSALASPIRLLVIRLSPFLAWLLSNLTPLGFLYFLSQTDRSLNQQDHSINKGSDEASEGSRFDDHGAALLFPIQRHKEFPYSLCMTSSQ